jgi:Arc/MetJ-type ribon-helix-helix transcriptional regulator
MAYKREARRGQPPLYPEDPLRSTNVNLPKSFYRRIDRLVKRGVFAKPSQAIRNAIDAGLKQFEKGA